MAKLGPVYKGDAGKVAAALAKVPAQEVADAMAKRWQHTWWITTKFSLNKWILADKKPLFAATRFIPHVVEPSFGSDRLFYVALEYAYDVKDDRVVLSFPRSIAPIQVGIYPLMGKDGLDTKAKEVQKLLTSEGFMTEYDETGSIGRRYARADEAGIQLGITIDYDTLNDGTVTIRDRDSWQQIRTRNQRFA